MRFGSQGVYSTLAIETTCSVAVRKTLRPVIRRFVAVVGWWPITWGSGITVTLSLMSSADRSHFLRVLSELGHGPSA